MTNPLPTIAVLGASGLIGEYTALWLLQAGFTVIPIARRFSSTQRSAFGEAAVECSVVTVDVAALRMIFAEARVEVVVNCIGVLQDGPGDSTEVVHADFVGRLTKLLASGEGPVLLIHLSIPGNSKEDRTPFSRTKREAERLIATSTIPFAILRPGFVVAPRAYGGSALMRGMATLPFDLAAREGGEPFAATDVADIARTVAVVARRWASGERTWSAVWDVMARQRLTVSEVLDVFRTHVGGPRKRILLPSWLIDCTARLGDLLHRLGWSPPIRTTAIREMRRGVTGDPRRWITDTGIEPGSLSLALRRLPATVQEKWFARLYLVKPLVLGSLVLLWILSGLIAQTVSFDAATTILTFHGIPHALAKGITAVSSLTDIAIGLMIAFKATCRIGLLVGVSVSLLYMAGAVAMTPELWIDPLGALIKTGPAIVLMLVAVAIMDDR
jgi:uncharacterized protein YbjT (DUF2867 family)